MNDMKSILATAEQGTASSVSLKDGLESCRVHLGLKKQQFAAVLGMPAPHYTEVVMGSRSMTLRQARRAHAVGVPAGVILQGPNGGQP